MGSYYTGVGSRSIPSNIAVIMGKFAKKQKKRTLRSGGAAGADTAFELYADKKNIFLPWPKAVEEHYHISRFTDAELAFADAILEEVFPYRLSKKTTINLFRRNVFQVLGKCDSISSAVCSDFLICYTQDGCTGHGDYVLGKTGGTGIAILIADMFNVEVFNMGRHDHLEYVLDYVNS